MEYYILILYIISNYLDMQLNPNFYFLWHVWWFLCSSIMFYIVPFINCFNSRSRHHKRRLKGCKIQKKSTSKYKKKVPQNTKNKKKLAFLHRFWQDRCRMLIILRWSRVKHHLRMLIILHWSLSDRCRMIRILHWSLSDRRRMINILHRSFRVDHRSFLSILHRSLATVVIQAIPFEDVPYDNGRKPM